jgi:hypothetical protein
MNRRLSILLALTSVLLWAVLISACKPESRSQVLQPASTPSAPPTSAAMTGASVAPAVAITSTLRKPPACQFNNVAAPASSPSVTSYIFSEPAVVYTRTGSGILSIYSWLPDSNHLLINGYDKNIDKFTVEVLNVQTGEIQRYAERRADYWAGWLPQQQALAYVDSESINAAIGTVRRDLWISRGNPKQAGRVASGINDKALAIDTAGRLTFFTQDQSNQPSGSQLQQLDIAVQAKQVTSLDLAQWDFSDSSRAQQDSQVKDRRIYSAWRPGQTSQILLYFTGSVMLLADTQTGEICRIEIRQQDKPLSGSVATWSPDGQHLAMLARPTMSEGREVQRHLAVIDMNTSQPFFPDLGSGDILDMEWGAGGRTLLALTKVLLSDAPGDVKYELYIIDVTAQTAQQVMPDATLGGGSGGSGEMSWSSDGRFLAVNCPIRSLGRPIIEQRICLITVSKAQ